MHLILGSCFPILLFHSWVMQVNGFPGICIFKIQSHTFINKYLCSVECINVSGHIYLACMDLGQRREPPTCHGKTTPNLNVALNGPSPNKGIDMLVLWS